MVERSKRIKIISKKKFSFSSSVLIAPPALRCRGGLLQHDSIGYLAFSAGIIPTFVDQDAIRS